MRLVCMHADTVDALKRLNIRFDDLTPTGLWASQYHLVGLTAEQMEGLEAFQIEVEDVTPAQLVQAAMEAQPAARATASEARPTPAPTPSEPTQGAVAGAMAAPGAAQALAAEPARPAGEAEVPLAQARDGGTRAAEAKAESRPEGKAAPVPATPLGGATPTGGQQSAPQKGAGGKGGGATPPAQAPRKGQPQPASAGAGGGQRYGTTRLRISVAGKYTEATVANGKIVVGGRTFDSPDQAAAELTKSRGDWTFWEYYDSADGKWRMLTRDWDSVLKSAAPGGR